MMKRFLILSLTICLFFALYSYQKGPPLRYDQEWPEKEWVEKRMKFHGIGSCFEENGKHYFYRNGRICDL